MQNKWGGTHQIKLQEVLKLLMSNAGGVNTAAENVQYLRDPRQSLQSCCLKITTAVLYLLMSPRSRTGCILSTEEISVMPC